MVSFLSLPAVRAPSNEIDTSGFGNALVQYGEAKRQREQEAYNRAQAEEAKTYARGRAAKADRTAEIESFGRKALAVDKMPEGPVRAAAWGMIVKNTGASGLTPEQLDPITGPKLLAAEAGLWNDPAKAEADRLDLEMKRAQVEKLRSGGGDAKLPSNVQEYKYYSTLTPEQQREYLRVRRATPYLDTGTAYVSPDVANPGAPPTSVIPKDLAQAEKDKVVGRERGEAEAKLPKLQSSLAAAEAKTSLVRDRIREALPMVNHMSAGVGSILGNVPNTSALDLKQKVATIVANLGFEELQQMRDNSPTGGALGAITERELALLQATKVSLETAQSPEQVRQHLVELDRILSEGAARRRDAYLRDVEFARSGTIGADPQPPNTLPDLKSKYGLE